MPILLIALFCLPLTSKAQSINKTMIEIGQTMEKISPQIFNKSKKLSEKEQKELKENALKLKALFEKAAPHFKRQTIAHRISYDVTQAHINEASQLISGPYDDYAKDMLRNTPGLCIRCHSNDLKGRTLFKDGARSEFSSSFDLAEYRFMTRNFKKALQSYDFFLNTSESDNDFLRREQAIKRILEITITYLDDYKEALNRLENLKTSKKIPPSLAPDIKEWTNILKNAQKDPRLLVKQINAKNFNQTIKNHIAKSFEDENDPFGAGRIYHLHNSRLLAKYFRNSPKEEHIPVILYYQAKIDNALNDNYLYSFSELFLKECMVRFPSSPQAKECYKQYEEDITISFSGSSGIHLPPDIKKELENLKEKVFGKESPQK